MNTQPAPTLTEEALADLIVQVTRPLDNIRASDHAAVLTPASASRLPAARSAGR